MRTIFFVKDYADDHSSQLGGRISHPDSAASQKRREQVDKRNYKDTSPQEAENQGVQRFCHRLKITDKDHVYSQEKKTGKIDSDSRCGQSQNFFTWRQENVGKQVGHNETKQNRNRTYDQRCLDGERLHFCNAILKTGSVVDGQDGLSSLFNTFAQRDDHNGSVGNNAVNTDACISKITQQLKIEDEDGKAGGNLYDKAWKSVG